MSDYTVRVGDREETLTISDLEQLDVRYTGPETGYHIIANGVSYRCRLREVSDRGKSMIVSVNGRELTVAIADELDALIQQLGFRTVAAAASGDARAPMPGLILEILVKEGDTVTTDQPLLVLEAMKMENVVKSSGAGTVQAVPVRAGEAVEKNQVLIEIA